MRALMIPVLVVLLWRVGSACAETPAEIGSANACIFDYPYLAQTSQLCYQVQSGMTVKVYTAAFSGNQRRH